MTNDFSSVKVGDRLWHTGHGWGSVTNVMVPNKIKVDFESFASWFLINGKGNWDTQQTLFWDKVEIIPPPRPKRMKKVALEVKPYKSPYTPGDKIVLAPVYEHHMSLPWCGPAQSVTIEVEDD